MLDYFEDIFEVGQDNEEIFYTITDSAMEHEAEEGYEELRESEKDAYKVGKFIMEVNDGGFDQYFINTEGLYARDTAEFLYSIGERRFLHLLEEAISIYKAVIPDDVKLDEFRRLDNEFFNIDQEGYKLLYDKFTDYFKDNIG